MSDIRDPRTPEELDLLQCIARINDLREATPVQRWEPNAAMTGAPPTPPWPDMETVSRLTADLKVHCERVGIKVENIPFRLSGSPAGVSEQQCKRANLLNDLQAYAESKLRESLANSLVGQQAPAAQPATTPPAEAAHAPAPATARGEMPTCESLTDEINSELEYCRAHIVRGSRGCPPGPPVPYGLETVGNTIRRHTGVFVYPAIEPLWNKAVLLKRGCNYPTLPEYPGEPQSGGDAVKKLEMLLEWLAAPRRPAFPLALLARGQAEGNGGDGEAADPALAPTATQRIAALKQMRSLFDREPIDPPLFHQLQSSENAQWPGRPWTINFKGQTLNAYYHGARNRMDLFQRLADSAYRSVPPAMLTDFTLSASPMIRGVDANDSLLWLSLLYQLAEHGQCPPLRVEAFHRHSRPFRMGTDRQEEAHGKADRPDAPAREYPNDGYFVHLSPDVFSASVGAIDFFLERAESDGGHGNAAIAPPSIRNELNSDNLWFDIDSDFVALATVADERFQRMPGTRGSDSRKVLDAVPLRQTLAQQKLPAGWRLTAKMGISHEEASRVMKTAERLVAEWIHPDDKHFDWMDQCGNVEAEFRRWGERLAGMQADRKVGEPSQTLAMADAQKKPADEPDMDTPLDEAGFVPMSDVWPQHFDTAGTCSRFLASHTTDIRQRKPSPNRREVYLPDWHRYWKKRETIQSEALDAEEMQERIADIEARKVEARAKKRRN
jgi:hypothetical protein